MPKSEKKERASQFPGPAEYDIKLTSKAPKYGFSKNQKLVAEFTPGPGPADYHIPCSIRDVPEFVRKKGNFNKDFTFI